MFSFFRSCDTVPAACAEDKESAKGVAEAPQKEHLTSIDSNL